MRNKCLAIILTLAMVFCLAACSGGSEEGPAQSESSEKGTEEKPAKDSDADNPLAGLAVKEDGTPYLLGYIYNETGSGWMSNNTSYVESLWKRAGGEFYGFCSDYDLNKEISAMEDLKQMNPDVILVHPSDSSAIAPAVQSVMDAGYPVFAVDMGVIGATPDSFIHADQVEMGRACGEYMVENFSKENPAVVLEIAGGLQQDGAQQRQKGFHEAIEGVDYIEIVQIIDGNWESSKAFDGVQDAFERNAEINAIYTHSDIMMQGIIEGLKVKDRLVPAGEEGHIVICSIDGDQTGMKGIRDGYVDAIAENNPVMHAAVAVNVMLSYLHGETIEDDYLLEVPVITADNVDDPQWWANLPEGDFDNWPVMEQDFCPIPGK